MAPVMNLTQAFAGAVFAAVLATLSFVIATAPRRPTGDKMPNFYGVAEGGLNATTGWFFLLALMFSWAAGVHMPATGPSVMGVAWVPMFFLGLFFSLLMAAVVSPEARRRDHAPSEAHPLMVRWPNAYFWAVLLLLGLLVVLGFAT